MGDVEMTGSVQAIEAQAQQILQEARIQAKAIITKAAEESSRILLSQGDVDCVRDECDRIRQEAEVEAERIVAQASEQSMLVRAEAGTKIDGIVSELVNIVTGETL